MFFAIATDILNYATSSGKVSGRPPVQIDDAALSLGMHAYMCSVWCHEIFCIVTHEQWLPDRYSQHVSYMAPFSVYRHTQAVITRQI